VVLVIAGNMFNLVAVFLLHAPLMRLNLAPPWLCRTSVR
jgi:hypothetical protein